jgi:hypothetical protein
MFGFFGFVCLKGKRRRWWSFALSLLGLQFVGGSIHRSRRRLFDAFCIRSECIAHMDGDSAHETSSSMIPTHLEGTLPFVS